MDVTQTIGSFAFIGVIVGFWGQIKNLIGRFFSIFIVHAKIDSETEFEALSSYCWKNKKKI